MPNSFLTRASFGKKGAAPGKPKYISRGLSRSGDQKKNITMRDATHQRLADNETQIIQHTAKGSGGVSRSSPAFAGAKSTAAWVIATPLA
jgi:hypothetical protein